MLSVLILAWCLAGTESAFTDVLCVLNILPNTNETDQVQNAPNDVCGCGIIQMTLTEKTKALLTNEISGNISETGVTWITEETTVLPETTEPSGTTLSSQTTEMPGMLCCIDQNIHWLNFGGLMLPPYKTMKFFHLYRIHLSSCETW